MTASAAMWLAFAVIFAVMLFIDLGRKRSGREVGYREALIWSIVWVSVALAFNAGIFVTHGGEKAMEFLAGYLVEKALSVDNLFVFIMIFGYFGIKGEHQSRILAWGILGAILLRAVFIFAGLELITRFTWLFYLFGVIVLISAWKMAFSDEEDFDPENNTVVRLARRLLPLTRKIRGDWFFTRRRGILLASPLFLTLLVVESSDVIFALDSIPAIFAVTTDPFIVFTSNIFAIMGLRALYFLLAGMMGIFIYLKQGVSFILAFIGVKMIILNLGYHIPVAISLGVILSSLVLSVAASLIASRSRLPEEIPAG